jgi:hypothetical protein
MQFGLVWRPPPPQVQHGLTGAANRRRNSGEMIMPDTPGTIDGKQFWQAIGQRATGSTIVTARSESGPAGLLGLSATHLCADPPTMLVSVDKRTSALATILEARHFAINYLPSGQKALADIFGGKSDLKGADRFGTASWIKLATGAPVLADAVSPAMGRPLRRVGQNCRGIETQGEGRWAQEEIMGRP